MTFPVLHPRYPSLISQCLSTQQGPLIATATVQHAIKPHLSLPWSSMSPYHPTSHHQPNLPPALPSSKPTTVFLCFSQVVMPLSGGQQPRRPSLRKPRLRFLEPALCFPMSHTAHCLSQILTKQTLALGAVLPAVSTLTF